MAKTLVGAAGPPTASTANTTQYWSIAGAITGPSTTEANKNIKFPTAGTLSQLFVRITANSVNATSTIRTRKNAVNGGQTVSPGNNATGAFTDTSGSDTLAANDLVAIQSVPGAATGTITFSIFSVVYDVTATTITRMATGPAATYATASVSRFNRSNSQQSSGGGTESGITQRIRKTLTAKQLGAFVSTNARTTNSTLTSRKNSAAGSQTRTIAGGGTGWQEDTTNSDSLVAGNDFGISLATLTGTQNLIIENIVVSFESSAGEGYAHTANSTGINTNFGSTIYLVLNGGTMTTLATTESQVQSTLRLGASHTFSELTFGCQSNTVNGASTCTLRDESVDTALAASIGASTSGHFSDSSDTATIQTGDNINYALVTGGSSGTMSVRYCSSWYVLAAGAAVERSLATETITLSEPGTPTRLSAKTRTRTDTAITVGESRARLAAKMRPLATQTVALSENIIRIKGKVKTLATETITIGGGTIARLLAKIRTGSDTTVIAENRTRLAAKNRSLATQTTSLSDSVTRIKSKLKSLATETITVGGGTAARLSAKIRAITLQTVALTDNRTRLKGGVRSLATQTVALSENIARTVARQVIRALATQTVTLSESIIRLKSSQRITSQTIVLTESTARLSTKLRALATQTITIGTGSIVRIKGAVKAISQTTIISENIARRLAKIRAIAAQTVALADSVTRQIIGGAVEITRTLSQTVVLSDSLGRRLTVQRILSQTVPMAESLVRVRGVLRTLSQSIPVSESRSRIKSASRLTSQTILSSDSITKRMTKIRAITQTILTAENVAQETVGNLVRSMVETITVSDSIVRRTAKLVILDQFVIIAEQASRISAKLRIIPAQTITLSDSATNELNVIIKNVIKTISQITTITDYAKIEVVKKSQRFRKILQPSIKRLISNHPAWLLGTRGMHNDYEEFSP